MGIVRSPIPQTVAAASGLHWFLVGTAFWATRASLLDRAGLARWWQTPRAPRPRSAAVDEDEAVYRSDAASATARERIRASAVSAAVAGGLTAGVFRGVRSIFPVTIFFGAMGFGGQHAYDFIDRRHTDKLLRSVDEEKCGETWLQRLSRSKWSPMTVLTDQEYCRLLEEKMLGLDTDIALIEEKIEALRKPTSQPKDRANTTQ